jgi:hypothetical protein
MYGIYISVILYVFYIHYFSFVFLLTEGMYQPSVDISLKFESEMESGNVSAV